MSRAAWGLVAVLLAGLAARAVLAWRPGHLPDVNLFLKWLRALHAHGLADFHDASRCNYPPLYVLILWVEGVVCAIVDPALADDGWLRAVLRVPTCLFDTVIAVALYAECRRLWGPRQGLAAAALYYLNPVALYNGAFWGQVDSIHTAGVVLAVIALNRGRPGWAGAALGLALMQKLQAVAFVPLVLFDAYRRGGVRGAARGVAAAAGVAAVVLAPFVITHCAQQALVRGYGVVGQYDRLSVNAFNVWQALGLAETPSSSTPYALIALAAGDADHVAADAAWYLAISWRTVSIVACALLYGVLLSVYSRVPGPVTRFAAAAACALVFFDTLTEMHERYAYPVIALLAPWAVVSAWRERLFVVLSIVMLLNLEYVESARVLDADLSWLMAAASIALIGWIAAERWLTSSATPAPVAPPPPEDEPVRPGVVLFRRSAAGVAAGAVLLTGAVIVAARATGPAPRPGVIELSALTPVQADMGYGTLQRNRSVSGAPIYLENTYYLTGLGTHARATVAYDIPAGVTRFTALVGVNRHADGRARIRVRLDDRAVYHSDLFASGDPPLELDIPLDDADCLVLEVLPVGRNRGDHVDWASARFVGGPGAP